MSNEHKFNRQRALTDMGQLVGFLIFLAVWIIDSFFMRFSTVIAAYIPLYINIFTGAILIAFAAVVVYKSYSLVFNKQNKKSEPITKSFFRFVRHPIYSAEILIYLGLFLFTFSLASAFVIVVIFIFLNYISSIEEKQMEEMFGNAYTSYKKKTGKWIPKFL